MALWCFSYRQKKLLNRIRDRDKDIIGGSFQINRDVSFIDLSLDKDRSEIFMAAGNLVVIKWQRKATNFIQALKRERPASRHLAIFLKPPLEKHVDFFHTKYRDSKWLKKRLGISRPLTREESHCECVRDRKSNLKWLYEECPVKFEIIDPYISI